MYIKKVQIVYTFLLGRHVLSMGGSETYYCKQSKDRCQKLELKQGHFQELGLYR